MACSAVAATAAVCTSNVFLNSARLRRSAAYISAKTTSSSDVILWRYSESAVVAPWDFVRASSAARRSCRSSCRAATAAEAAASADCMACLAAARSAAAVRPFAGAGVT